MNETSLPTISVILFVYNEGENLRRLLPSLKSQTYPKEKIEYIAIDDESTDDSAELLRRFGAKVYTIDRSKISHAVSYRTEYNKGLGLHKSRGKFVYWVDADMELCDDRFFQNLIQPMLDDPRIAGSFTREFALDCQELVSDSFLRFISYDDTQRDPVLAFFSTNIEKTVIDERSGYCLCQFTPEKVPASGRIMYRRDLLLSVNEIRNDPAFYDLDALQLMVETGYQLYAFVPRAKIRHYHVSSFGHFVRKRLRNLEGNFFSTLGKKKFFWFRTDNSRDLIKIVLWIVYANLILPEALLGIWNSFKHRDPAFLWRPVAALVMTDLLVWKFVSTSQGKGVVKRVLGFNG